MIANKRKNKKRLFDIRFRKKGKQMSGPSITDLSSIKKALSHIDTISIMEEGFIAYSNGEVVVPPVGEMLFSDPPGDVHIKYGYIKHDDFYVIKIASGFYQNSQLGLPSSQGMMLLFNQKTGELQSILLDEGHLTDIRTAAAGAVVAKHLAPKLISGIGIIGTGTQARLQLEYLSKIITCKNVWVWGRNQKNVSKFVDHFSNTNLEINIASDIQEIGEYCNLIVTTTPSTSPLLKASYIKPGTHITAMGSDTSDKIELEPALLGKADLIISDSISQSETRGEIFQARKNNVPLDNKLVELGNTLSGKIPGRQDDQQITIADLTGVAVQDIQIAKAVFKQVKNENF
ncbi:hypothetical protein QQ008_20235 [Fulvivirgaceae bacterium BMA10]|uniref:Ornithine cyclodeaminase family protein n=1 Tax=Splendidivirga corallicola TaxID=3051826 RepID=A0ABT8KWA3_9BACT|nr:hypothetical protein [Fulvivirgaceae bacterium BMA10]